LWGSPIDSSPGQASDSLYLYGASYVALTTSHPVDACGWAGVSRFPKTSPATIGVDINGDRTLL